MSNLKRPRLSFLKDNKFQKYLLYASGEIILVVIGILIALSVNNWNSKRLETKRVNRFIENLKTELEGNLTSLDNYISENTTFYTKSTSFLNIIGQKATHENLDKLDSLILFNSLDYNLNLNLNVLIEGRENGDLALIASDSIRKSIYYFMNLNKETMERERITNAQLNTFFTPYLSKNISIKNLIDTAFGPDGFGKSKIYKKDNRATLDNLEFENIITMRIFNGKELLDMYIELRDVLTNIKSMLNQKSNTT